LVGKPETRQQSKTGAQSHASGNDRVAGNPSRISSQRRSIQASYTTFLCEEGLQTRDGLSPAPKTERTNMSSNAVMQSEADTIENSLYEEGYFDGAAYAGRAPYRELRLVEKFVQSSGTDFGGPGITSVTLACKVCETERLDQDSKSWIEDNLSDHWQSEESYVRGFINGALGVMSGEVEIEKD